MFALATTGLVVALIATTTMAEAQTYECALERACQGYRKENAFVAMEELLDGIPKDVFKQVQYAPKEMVASAWKPEDNANTPTANAVEWYAQWGDRSGTLEDFGKAYNETRHDPENQCSTCLIVHPAKSNDILFSVHSNNITSVPQGQRTQPTVNKDCIYIQDFVALSNRQTQQKQGTYTPKNNEPPSWVQPLTYWCPPKNFAAPDCEKEKKPTPGSCKIGGFRWMAPSAGPNVVGVTKPKYVKQLRNAIWQLKITTLGKMKKEKTQLAGQKQQTDVLRYAQLWRDVIWFNITPQEGYAVDLALPADLKQEDFSKALDYIGTQLGAEGTTFDDKLRGAVGEIKDSDNKNVGLYSISIKDQLSQFIGSD